MAGIARIRTGKLLSAGSTSDVWHRYDCYLMRCTEFRVNCARGLRVINIINARIREAHLYNRHARARHVTIIIRHIRPLIP